MNSHLKLHAKTPFLESYPLTQICGRKVFLKMDSSQPAGSFKTRGIGNFVQKQAKGTERLISASGGNAGMATAYVGKKLNIPVSIIIPETTPKLMIPMIEAEGAEVLVHGKVWDEANEMAMELSKKSGFLYVPPFDDKLIWDGNESIMEEILDACPEDPSAVVCSVGGGGLLCGILQGLQRRDLKIPVVTMETEGADCFSKALEVGQPVNIGKITSIAKTLGALKVTSRVFDFLPSFEILSHVVEDSAAIDACVRFADDHRTLVEPSCGATLAAGYSGIISNLISEGKIKGTGPIVFIVCGGNAVTLDLLKEWKQNFPVGPK